MIKKVAILYIWAGNEVVWQAQLALLGPNDIAVINGSDNGPDPTMDPSLKRHIAEARARGVTVLGYVHLSYGARPIKDVEIDIMMWDNQTIKGVFFDEWGVDVPQYVFLRTLAGVRWAVSPTIADPIIMVVNPGGRMYVPYKSPNSSTYGYRALVVEYEGIGLPTYRAPNPWSVALVYQSTDVAADFVRLEALGWQYGWVTKDGADGNPYDGPAI